MIGSPAATYVNGLQSRFTDWYLPSIDELSILWCNRFHANRGLNNASATLLLSTDCYWRTKESLVTFAFYIDFSYGDRFSYPKTTTFSLRAVRAF